MITHAQMCVAACCIMPLIAAAAVSIEPLTSESTGKPVATAPFVQADAAFWKRGEPTFTTSAGDVSSKGWVAVTDRHLRLHIVVTDPEHGNDYHERSLWRGDCIYVSLDMRGDTTGELIERQIYEPDDAIYTFGLGSRGAEGRVGPHHARTRRGQGCNEFVKSIVRDEQVRTTTYDLAIDYADLHYAMGQSDRMGLAVHVAHKSPKQKADQSWGVMRGKKRELKSVKLQWPDGPFATLAAKRYRAFDDETPASVILAARGYEKLEVNILAQGDGAPTGQAETVPVGDGIRRFRVVVGQEVSVASQGRVTVLVEDPSGRVVTASPFVLDSVSAAASRVRQALLEHKVGSGLLPVDDRLVLRHLRDTWAVLRAEKQKLPLRSDREEIAEKFIDTANLILEKLRALPQTRRSYTKRCLPMVRAFVSEYDRSLQWYWLQLPCDFDPSREYPLTVYLHGAGSDEPLDGLSTAFDNTHQDTLFTWEEKDPGDIPPSHRGFVLFPWSRGNSMYWQAGQADVLQTVKLMREEFKIDSDRMYLTGFSMGCGGAYGIAGRTPDMWAGLGLASGFGPWAETTNTDFLKANLRHVPVHIWCGELDRMVGPAKDFAERMEAAGVPSKAVFPDRMPHTYPYEHFQRNVGWLMQFTRRRPDRFTYTIDSFRFPGTRGIEMAVPLRRRIIDGKWPTFTCELDGQTVRIDSKHTTGLRIRLGADGLGLDGEVTVIWNGEQAYKGPAEMVIVGEGFSR